MAKRKKEPLPPLDVGCADPLFTKVVESDKDFPPQIEATRDAPGFGIAKGDTLIFENRWPRLRDLIVFSLEADPTRFAIARFLGCYGDTIRVENFDGTTYIERHRTMYVVRQIVMELRLSKRGKKREDVRIIVTRGKVNR